MLFMLRKRPVVPGEADEIVRNWSLARPVLVPSRVATPPYADLLAGRTTLAQYDASSPTRVGPVYDDSPFYFATSRPWGMHRTIARMLLLVLVAPSLVLLVLFATFGKPRGERAAPYLGSLAYFTCLGFGFISVELSLLQHLTLLLGHPSFTLSVLLCTLLASGGLGSAMSRHVSSRLACGLVTVLGAIGAFVLPGVVPALLPLALWLRVMVAVAVVAPLGLAMGVPFPRGLQRAGRGALPAPPFYWGLNGITSVIGSVATVMIALTAGFKIAMLVGCACYAVAALAAPAIEQAERAAPAGAAECDSSVQPESAS
jgi:hypothetical protein